MDLHEFLIKLQRVLGTRKELVVVARTDTQNRHERIARATAFPQAGAGAILMEAILDLEAIRYVESQNREPLMVDQQFDLWFLCLFQIQLVYLEVLSSYTAKA